MSDIEQNVEAVKTANRIISAIILVALSSIAVVFWVAKPWIEHDERTYCLTDGDEHRTAILIDASDRLTENHVERVYGKVREFFAERVNQYEWVGTYVLDEELAYASLEGLEGDFIYCYPAKAWRWYDHLLQKPEQAEKLARELFWDPFRQDLHKSMTDRDPQSKSPILQMLKGVMSASTRFMEPLRDGTMPKRRLIIVSDMLEITNEYSHYHGPISFEAFREVKSPTGELYSDQFLPPSVDFQDIEVEILYVVRRDLTSSGGKLLQTGAHQRFWKKYFSQSGVDIGIVIIEDKPCRTNDYC